MVKTLLYIPWESLCHSPQRKETVSVMETQCVSRFSTTAHQASRRDQLVDVFHTTEFISDAKNCGIRLLWGIDDAWLCCEGGRAEVDPIQLNLRVIWCSWVSRKNVRGWLHGCFCELVRRLKGEFPLCGATDYHVLPSQVCAVNGRCCDVSRMLTKVDTQMRTCTRGFMQ